MKKLLATNAMLMAVFFCGCEWPDARMEKELIIDNISIANTKEAEYTITSRDNSNTRGLRFLWTDSIGKFNIGDTVTIAKKHCY